MTSPAQSSTPLGTGLPYLGIPQNNPGQNWYRRRDPTVRDFRNYQVLDRWINLATHTIFYLTAKTAGSATWAAISGGGSGMQTLGDGFGVSVSPAGGEVEILGTANEILSS